MLECKGARKTYQLSLFEYLLRFGKPCEFPETTKAVLSREITVEEALNTVVIIKEE